MGETRDYFNGIAPKRHTKPQRSDHDSSKYVDELETTQIPCDIPEHVEFQRLETDDPQVEFSDDITFLCYNVDSTYSNLN